MLLWVIINIKENVLAIIVTSIASYLQFWQTLQKALETFWRAVYQRASDKSNWSATKVEGGAKDNSSPEL